jgi:tetratricopeptide (TPR) repeat protein
MSFIAKFFAERFVGVRGGMALNKGARALAKGDAAAAIASFEDAVAAKAAAMGTQSHPVVAQAMTQLAAAHRLNGDNDRAAEVLVDAVEIFQQKLPADPETAVTMNNLAVMLRNTGRHEQAREVSYRKKTCKSCAFGHIYANCATFFRPFLLCYFILHGMEVLTTLISYHLIRHSFHEPIKVFGEALRLMREKIHPDNPLHHDLAAVAVNAARNELAEGGARGVFAAEEGLRKLVVCFASEGASERALYEVHSFVS